jgi:hypothetical protein
MKGLVLPNRSDNLPEYIEVIIVKNMATEDIIPKSRREPFRELTKYSGTRLGNMPKATP